VTPRPSRCSSRPPLAVLAALLAVTVGTMHARAIPANAATPSTATISAIAAAMPALAGRQLPGVFTSNTSAYTVS